MKRFYEVYLNGRLIRVCAADDPVEAYKKTCKVNKFPVLIMKDMNRNETYKVTRHYGIQTTYSVESV